MLFQGYTFGELRAQESSETSQASIVPFPSITELPLTGTVLLLFTIVSACSLSYRYLLFKVKDAVKVENGATHTVVGRVLYHLCDGLPVLRGITLILAALVSGVKGMVIPMPSGDRFLSILPIYAWPVPLEVIVTSMFVFSVCLPYTPDAKLLRWISK